MKASANYRDLLKDEFEARCGRNPRYSLRSFARDLAVTPARLSDVLRGRYGLSREAALAMASALGWSKSESQHFSDLVESEHARNKTARQAAQKRLSATPIKYQRLTLDAFKVVSDWHHYAILELMTLEGFQNDPSWMAKRLGLNRLTISSALQRLKRLGLIKEVNGRLTPTDSFTATPDGIPSDSIKKFHQQILEKALTAIHMQTVAERNLSSIVFAFDTDRMAEASSDIQKFRRDFDKKYSLGDGKKEVYCLAVQLFSLEAQRVPRLSLPKGEK